MGGDHHRLPVAALGDLGHGIQYTAAQLCHRFTAVGLAGTDVAPEHRIGGVIFRKLIEGFSLPDAGIDLPQAGIGLQRQTQRFCHSPARMGGAAKVTGIYGIHLIVCQYEFRRQLCLAVAQLCQLQVQMPCKHTPHIAHALPVADKKQCCHGITSADIIPESTIFASPVLIRWGICGTIKEKT